MFDADTGRKEKGTFIFFVLLHPSTVHSTGGVLFSISLSPELRKQYPVYTGAREMSWLYNFEF